MKHIHIKQAGLTKEQYARRVQCFCPIHGTITGPDLYVWTISLPNRKPYFKAQCLACKTERFKKWVGSNMPRAAQLARYHRRREREKLIEAYGGVCLCCGENTFEFLTIDHIDGKGADHRRTFGGRQEYGSRKLHMWLKQNGYPKGNFRLLCYNCNCAIGAHGYCPHEKSQILKGS